jgi:hypothetical protein
VKPTTRPIFGIDAVQALLLALQFARVVLEVNGRPQLMWLGKPGDLGLPRAIPEYLPVLARKRIEAVIDRETSRVAKSDPFGSARIQASRESRRTKHLRR